MGESGGDSPNREFLLDSRGWRVEAAAVIKDVEDHVTEAALSEELPSDDSRIFMNLTTKENQKLTLRLDFQGIAVVSKDRHDSVGVGGEERHETVHALLDTVSPLYRQSFGQSLVEKLNGLKGSV